MVEMNLETVQTQVTEFDKMKFIDDDGKEKISGRDLAKALGYTDWRNFKAAVKRTNDQIENSGKGEEHIVEVTEVLKVKNQYGVEARKKISDFHLTRKQAINVANNADTSKPEVAMVQEWLYDTSEIGERTMNIYKKLKDRKYIDDRSALSISNRNFSGKCLEHGVEASDLGIVHDACDKALYQMSTEEIKEEYGKSNRPKADFLGSLMCSAETFAKDLSSLAMDTQGAVGINDCVNVSTEIHGEIRDQIISRTGKAPENLITGEDVKKVQRRYDKLTKEQLKAISQEF